jgi:hypothetical protein
MNKRKWENLQRKSRELVTYQNALIKRGIRSELITNLNQLVKITQRFFYDDDIVYQL